MGNVQSNEGERMVIRAIQVFLILVTVACGQEDTDIVIMEDRPMVFPEPMMQAEEAICDLFGNESDHLLFMSDDYWPIWLNNSTIA